MRDDGNPFDTVVLVVGALAVIPLVGPFIVHAAIVIAATFAWVVVPGIALYLLFLRWKDEDDATDDN